MRKCTFTPSGALLAALVVVLASGGPATAQGDGREIEVATRLAPIADVTGGTSLAWRPGDRTPYLARQSGSVVPLAGGRAGQAVLDVSDRITAAGSEQGLLGLTFSPDGRRMYVYFTAIGGENLLVEYPVAGSAAGVRVAHDRGRTLLRIPHPLPNHNGGQIEFGPDGMLYVALGDGGGYRGTGPGQAPGGNSQSLDTLLGKILRIDPTPSGAHPYTVPADNPFAAGGGLPEIWHFGLRNPWRFSFDRGRGDLWIGDVGQDDWEEIDVAPARSGGLNFGYPRLEGSHPLLATAAPDAVLPVHEISHRDGYCSVIGGAVYRGRAIPALRGFYVFADYCRGDLEAIRVHNGNVVADATTGLRAPKIVSFAQGPGGELYVVSQETGVLRLAPR